MFTIAAKMGMADVNPQSGYLPLLAYAQSNTANMLFTVQLAESLRGKGICSFSAAPGGMFAPPGYVMQSSPADSTQSGSKPNFNVICPKVSAIRTCSIRRQVKV
jgi:NAD(P)-dependent dehydrogenase (short-subunit alcohol dehydrogenase family)